MTTLTKQTAWVIFCADKRGHTEQVESATNNMSKEEFDAYEAFAEEFDLQAAKIGIEAQNEAAAIMERHPELQYLGAIETHEWNAMDYRSLVTPFAGTKFEKLHLSAMFRVPNGELLLELVKP